MIAYVKVENGVVVQKQPYFEEGFIEAPDWVVCGMLYDGTAFTNPPPGPVVPMPYSLPVSIFWLRMNDTEAEDFDAAISTASPLRLRKAFNTATSMSSEGELFGFVRNVLVTVVSLERATEIMAAPNGDMSSALAGDVAPLD